MQYDGFVVSVFCSPTSFNGGTASNAYIQLSTEYNAAFCTGENEMLSFICEVSYSSI